MMAVWHAVQLDDWLAQHEAKEAAEKAADQNDDGWTVVRRKGVRLRLSAEYDHHRHTDTTWARALAEELRCQNCVAGKKEDHRCYRHRCWISGSCCC